MYHDNYIGKKLLHTEIDIRENCCTAGVGKVSSTAKNAMNGVFEKIRKNVVPLALAAGVLCAGFGAWRDIRATKIQQGIAAQVIRFHVLADSDSAWDQANKLAVRDAVLGYLNDVLPGEMNVVQTESFIENHLKNIQQVAEETLTQRNCSDPVQACLVQDDFPEKTYGDCTFPAGTYEALRVSIGRAEGHNWWCMIYPGLCFNGENGISVSEENKTLLKGVLTEEEFQTVAGKGRIHLGFKILEFLE